VIDREPQIEIEVEPDLEGRLVVLVSGSVDLVEAAELRTVLHRVCDGDCPGVVLDLSDVTFVGSSGLGVIVEAHQVLEGQRRTFVVRGTAPAIRKAFEITQLDRIIHLEPDDDPASTDAASV
jgi:anti-sigma B factor antagonist